MPAPATYEYSADAIKDANTALLALIDAGSSNAEIKLYDDSDQLLATIPLNDPAGTVNASTGVLTITASGPDTAADDNGTCTYGTIVDSDGNVIVSIPAEAGTSAVSGKLVINSTTIVAGAEVSLTSCTIGG
jgi:hypothetical protein